MKKNNNIFNTPYYDYEERKLIESFEKGDLEIVQLTDNEKENIKKQQHTP